MKRGLLKKKPPPLTAQAIQPQNDKTRAQLLRNENDNPSRGYKNTICERNGTTGRNFDTTPHSTSRPYQTEKKEGKDPTWQ